MVLVPTSWQGCKLIMQFLWSICVQSNDEYHHCVFTVVCCIQDALCYKDIIWNIVLLCFALFILRSFCRRRFGMHCLNWKRLNFTHFNEVCSKGLLIKINISAGDGLVPAGDKPLAELLLTNDLISHRTSLFSVFCSELYILQSNKNLHNWNPFYSIPHTHQHSQNTFIIPNVFKVNNIFQ